MKDHYWECPADQGWDVPCECPSGWPRPTSALDDEEEVPHAFNSRTRYEPGDERDIWCKDCEYHRDHKIHAGATSAPQEPQP